MNKETERKYESAFIPCGDALEKMELFTNNDKKIEEDRSICSDQETTT